jgi:hypothetical protein
LAAASPPAETLHAGFIYDDFSLTLAPGHRTEILGPLYYSEQKESQHTWAFPLLTLAHTAEPDTGYEEFDFTYPLLTLDRFGTEYRWQFLQLFNIAGGKNQDENGTRRVTLFPFYFQQRSTDTNLNYTAFVPFYGHMKHRLFRDEIDFVMFPLYSKTRKKDIITYNMPYPVFHLRRGDGLTGWQVWPLAGHEHKEITTPTNLFGDPETSGGHDSRFVLWPFFMKSTNDIGTTNQMRQEALIPFYSVQRSKLRDSTTWSWPLGVTHTLDREQKYEEWDLPWPLIEFAHGEGKSEQRVWPFYSFASNSLITAGWYCWPVYKYNHLISPPLDRERRRILFFLYSKVDEKNTETGKAFRREDLWPIYTHRHEFNGNESLQVLALLEPIFPNNTSLQRDYSPLYYLWRAEKNPREHTASQSLLWNLYRREAAPQSKKISLLFGLFQYESNMEERRWRLCYIPMGRASPRWPTPAWGH